MRAKVTIDITYDSACCSSDKEIERALNFAVMHLANNGLLADSESIVDEYSYTVEVLENDV